MAHRHKADIEGTHCGFSTCANPDNCNPVAHGNISMTAFCSCGASRNENHNGQVECGEWRRQGSTHFTNLGVTTQPREADNTGFLNYRQGYGSLPRNMWTTAELWLHAHRISEQRSK